jgi:hypothetical protein
MKNFSTQKNIKKFTFVLFYLLLVNCQSNLKTNSSNSSLQDKNYKKSLQEHTRKSNLSNDFNIMFTIYASSINNKFFNVFKAKYYEIFPQAQKSDDTIIQKINNKTAFIISIYSPDSNLLNLKNKKQWNIYLEENNKNLIFPLSLTPLKKTDSWNSFFPFINDWTRDYLVIFDRSNAKKLILSSPKGRAQLLW